MWGRLLAKRWVEQKVLKEDGEYHTKELDISRPASHSAKVSSPEGVVRKSMTPQGNLFAAKQHNQARLATNICCTSRPLLRSRCEACAEDVRGST